MEFVLDGKPVLLKGLQPFGLDFQDSMKFFKPTIKKGLCLQVVSPNPSSVSDQVQPEIEDLLTEFSSVFAVPSSLPHLRGHEHWILLKEGLKPSVKDLIGTLITKNLKLRKLFMNY